MGRSFVAGIGVADKETWTYLLNQRLQSLSTRYEVILAERAGGATIDSVLSNLIDRTVKFDPDYLIVFSAYNNHILPRHSRKLSLGWKMSNFLYNISFSYATLREKAALMMYKDNNFWLYNYDIATTKREVDDLIKAYRKRLDQIYVVCKENNIEPILGLQPEFIPVALENLQDLLDEEEILRMGRKLERQGHLMYYELEYYLQGRLNLEMKEFADQEGILLFDCVSIFPKNKYAYFVDQIHPNAKGTLLIADELHSFLLKSNVVKG